MNKYSINFFGFVQPAWYHRRNHGFGGLLRHMPQGGDPDHPDDISGSSIDTAVDVVVDRGEAPDRETAKEVLETVSDDGVVSWNGVRDAFADLAKVVSTPETRLELAVAELNAARETAESIDRPVVQSRLVGYEDRLNDLEERVDGLGAELRRLLELRGTQGALYEVASGIRSLERAANDCQRAADELMVDLEEFQRWLSEPNRRFDQLEGDTEALEQTLEEVGDIAESLEANGDEPASSNGDGGDRWFEATVRTRMLGLVLEDLRWELDELRRWNQGGSDAGGNRADELSARFDELAEHRETLEDRLGALASSAWEERFADALEATEDELSRFEPPIAWGEVEEAIAPPRGDRST